MCVVGAVAEWENKLYAFGGFVELAINNTRMRVTGMWDTELVLALLINRNRQLSPDCGPIPGR